MAGPEKLLANRCPKNPNSLYRAVAYGLLFNHLEEPNAFKLAFKRLFGDQYLIHAEYIFSLLSEVRTTPNGDSFNIPDFLELLIDDVFTPRVKSSLDAKSQPYSGCDDGAILERISLMLQIEIVVISDGTYKFGRGNLSVTLIQQSDLSYAFISQFSITNKVIPLADLPEKKPVPVAKKTPPLNKATLLTTFSCLTLAEFNDCKLVSKSWKTIANEAKALSNKNYLKMFTLNNHTFLHCILFYNQNKFDFPKETELSQNMLKGQEEHRKFLAVRSCDKNFLINFAFEYFGIPSFIHFILENDREWLPLLHGFGWYEKASFNPTQNELLGYILSGNIPELQKFLSCHSDFNLNFLFNCLGVSPLLLARIMKQFEVAKILETHGAKMVPLDTFDDQATYVIAWLELVYDCPTEKQAQLRIRILEEIFPSINLNQNSSKTMGGISLFGALLVNAFVNNKPMEDLVKKLFNQGALIPTTRFFQDMFSIVDGEYSFGHHSANLFKICLETGQVAFSQQLFDSAAYWSGEFLGALFATYPEQCQNALKNASLNLDAKKEVKSELPKNDSPRASEPQDFYSSADPITDSKPAVLLSDADASRIAYIAVRDDDDFEDEVRRYQLRTQNELKQAEVKNTTPKVPLLMEACASRNISNVRFLLSKGMDPFCKDENGNTIFHLLAVSIRYQAVGIFEKADKFYPNMLSRWNDYQKLWDEMIRAGYFKSQNLKHLENGLGRTPFHIAALSGSYDVIPKLSEAKLDVNAQDLLKDTPLHLAMRSILELIGNNTARATVSALLEMKEIIPSIKNSSNNTPMDILINTYLDDACSKNPQFLAKEKREEFFFILKLLVDKKAEFKQDIPARESTLLPYSKEMFEAQRNKLLNFLYPDMSSVPHRTLVL